MNGRRLARTQPTAVALLNDVWKVDVAAAYNDTDHPAHAVAYALVVAAAEYGDLTDMARRAAVSAAAEVARIAEAIDTRTVRMHVGTASHGVEMRRTLELSMLTAHLIAAERQIAALANAYLYAVLCEHGTPGTQTCTDCP